MYKTCWRCLHIYAVGVLAMEIYVVPNSSRVGTSALPADPWLATPLIV